MKSVKRPLGIIMVSLFGFLLIITFYADKSNFEVSTKEMQTIVLTKDYSLTRSVVKQMSDAQLIDIRNAEYFAINHDSSALNIPLPTILDDIYHDLFESDRPKVILAHDPIKANEAWMLLTQLGYKEIYVGNIN